MHRVAYVLCSYANYLPSGFSPHEAHAHQAFFGWIMPTIRTSEFTILQIVGLDAAVVCRHLYIPAVTGANFDTASY